MLIAFRTRKSGYEQGLLAKVKYILLALIAETLDFKVLEHFLSLI